MDHLLAETSLSPELTPRKFKFTSQQGRSRRTRLLTAARELLRERPPEELSFADVCERAEIPRPSAYHFFPNIQALFLGLRLLHAEALGQAITAVDIAEFDTWQDYIIRLVQVGADITREDPALMRLIYGLPGMLSEARHLGKVVDARIADTALRNLAERFALPEWPERDSVFAIAFAIIDSIFRLAFRQHGAIPDAMIQEAGRAAIAYLRTYLPEILAIKKEQI